MSHLQASTHTDHRVRQLRKTIAEQAEIIGDYLNQQGDCHRFVELHAHHILAALHEIKRLENCHGESNECYCDERILH
jgi:hypothetical protein